MDKVELRARLDFWQSALSKLRAAYLALVDGGVKSYVIDLSLIHISEPTRH